MLIYPNETVDGLGELIELNKTLAYTSQLSIAEPVDFNTAKFKNLDLARATNKDQIDLHYLQSILVTTNWNKNDDVFTPAQAWRARHTPEDKPLNLEHDPDQILGHITDCWAVDTDLNLIPDDTEEDKLPDKFHILTSAVIYKNWHQDQDLTEMIEEVLAGIEAGNYYVSMECLLRDFGYALADNSGKVTIIDRDANTSYLTKYLRVYGGKGIYNGKRIGRVVKDIIFSGKALVENPANPESIIFPQTNKAVASNNFNISEKLVYILSNENSEISESVMSDQLDTFKLLKEDNDKLVKKLSEATERADKLEAKLKDIDSEAIKAKVTKFEQDIAVRDEKIEVLEKSVAELNKTINANKSDLEKSEATVKELTGKLDEIAKADKARARVDMLVAVGLNADEAKAKVEKFTSLADEQFGEIVKICTKAPDNKTDKESVKASEVLEGAEKTDNVVPTVPAKASENNDMEALRKDFENSFTVKASKAKGAKE